MFFFKQKTAYEMLRSLVGSEMCIRDRSRIPFIQTYHEQSAVHLADGFYRVSGKPMAAVTSVSYTHLTLPTIYSV